MSTTKFKSWILLLYLWINGGIMRRLFDEKALAYYYVQKANGNTPQCTLATPPLTRGNSVQLPADLGIAENESVRVGYIQTSYIFLNLGCALYNHVGPPHATMVKKDIGQCYRICGLTYNYIGVSDTACFCFHGKPTYNKETLCTNACDYPKGALCGGGTHTSYNHYISLYKTVDVENTGGNDAGSCLTVSPRRHTLAWQDCTSQRLGLCTSFHGQRSGPTKYSWSEFVKACLSGGGLPVNPNHAKQNSAEYFWSGVIRQLYIEEDNNLRSSLGKILDGYIVKNGTSYILQFGNIKGSTKLLCSADGTRKTSSQTITVTTRTLIPTLIVTSVFVPARTVSTSDLNRTTANKETTTELHVSQSAITKGGYIPTSLTTASDTYRAASNEDEETETNAAMLAVYVTVPVAVLAVVVGVICIVRIVRIKRKNGTNSRPEMRHDDIKASGAAINATYDGESVQIGPGKIQEHNYFILEKTNGLEKTAAATTTFDNCCSEDIHYNLPNEQTDGVYDHTGGNKEQTKPDVDTYNHLGQDAGVDGEAVYNATQKWGNMKHNDHVTENVYDSTRADDTYNTAQKWGELKECDNVSENVYDSTRADDTYNTAQKWGELKECDNVSESVYDRRRIEETYNTTHKWRNVNDNCNVKYSTYDRAGSANDDNEYSTTGMLGVGQGSDDTYSHTVR